MFNFTNEKALNHSRILMAAIGVIVVFVSCTTEIPELEPPVVKIEEERILLVDDTGMEWDITHAVFEYRMNPELFQFGYGPNAIPPIINPKHIAPGERGYPFPDDRSIVIATTINGESRAYSIDLINSNEMVDDSFGDVHVAVGW
jgi:hypothetical protein